MQILKNTNLMERQSENYVKNELSNVAMVLSSPPVMVEYYSINVDATPTMDGMLNVQDFIGGESVVVYDKIDNLPMCGIDNLLIQSQFDDDLGMEEHFDSSGVIFPNTIVPKPNDFFIVKGDKNNALYVVTGATYTTVRTNPFVEVTFSLYTRRKATIEELRNQVAEKYTTIVTALGADKTMVIKEENYFTIQDHVKTYLDLMELYVTVFYDKNRASFIFDGFGDPDMGNTYRLIYVDITLWKFMFDNQIAICDDVVTYANNNLNMTVQRLFTSCPDMYIESGLYTRSIIARLMGKHPKFDEYRYPQLYVESNQITKFTGVDVIYLEDYSQIMSTEARCLPFNFFDDEFVTNVKNKTHYDTARMDVNASLRNAVIDYYNGVDIDYDGLVITDAKTVENFYLIPMVLGMYKQYIATLK